MFQCFSGPYSALFDKSSRKEEERPIIIPRAAYSYLVAAKKREKTLKCGIVGQSLSRWIIAKCSWIFSGRAGVSNWQHEAEFAMSWHGSSWHGFGPCGRPERGVLYPIQGNNNTTIKRGCIYPRSLAAPSGLSSWQPLPCLSFGHGSAAKKQLQPWLGWKKSLSEDLLR